LVENGSRLFELENTINVLVGIVKRVIVAMSKAFVPQNLGSTGVEMVKQVLLGAWCARRSSAKICEIAAREEESSVEVVSTRKLGWVGKSTGWE
jgi:hypothetical protein